MTLKDLKAQEFAYLKSGREQLRQYALAFRDIIKMYNEFSGDFLSDEVLISDCAKKYVESIEREYLLTKDENFRLRAKAASDLFVYKYVKYEDLYEEIKKYGPISFEKARNILKTRDYYNKIHPNDLNRVLKSVFNNEKR